MGFLAHAFPQMVESYGRLYAGAYAAPEYVERGARTDRHVQGAARRPHRPTGGIETTPEPDEEPPRESGR